jgi:hypothetical protein
MIPVAPSKKPVVSLSELELEVLMDLLDDLKDEIQDGWIPGENTEQIRRAIQTVIFLEDLFTNLELKEFFGSPS